MSHILRDKFCGATTVGERGQIVIPAEARKEYGLEIGDKVMVFMSHHGTGLIIIKADQVTQMLSQTIDQLGRIVAESSKPQGDEPLKKTSRHDQMSEVGFHGEAAHSKTSGGFCESGR